MWRPLDPRGRYSAAKQHEGIHVLQQASTSVSCHRLTPPTLSNQHQQVGLTSPDFAMQMQNALTPSACAMQGQKSTTSSIFASSLLCKQVTDH